MIWGTGVPKVQIVMPDGSVAQTYTLPEPPRDGRDMRPEFEADPMDNPLTGERLPRVFGVRWKFQLVYTGITSAGEISDYDSGLADDLLEIANVRKPQKLIFQPHSGAAAFGVYVSAFDLSYVKGCLRIDQIMIEFTQRDFGKIFNPDTYYAATNRGVIA